MKFIIPLLFLILPVEIFGQQIIEEYTQQNDSLQIGPGKSDFIQYNEKGYTLILPDTVKNISGVIISLEDKNFNLKDSTQQIYPQAITKNFAVLYVSTGVPVDLYFSEMSLVYIDSLMANIFTRYNLPKENIFFLGVSLSGHRALKYIEFCHNKKSIFNPDIKGVILCEGVLDWVRQWYEGKKGIRDNFSKSSVFEGKLVTYLLEKNLGGTPKNNLQRYLEFSPYSYFDEKDRHIEFYKDCAVRAYTEQATYYWIEAKRKSTFDTNFPDMVGIINELKLNGNTKSELIIFTQDKNNMDRRSPYYTWGLVDKAELMEWLIAQTK